MKYALLAVGEGKEPKPFHCMYILVFGAYKTLHIVVVRLSRTAIIIMSRRLLNAAAAVRF
jgi:hypothetical protein